MLRSLSQRALKAAPRPGLRLSASRHVHSMKAPFIGTPTYDTIAQRFSLSQPDPHAYFKRKRDQDAIVHGRFLNRYEDANDPYDYDLWITDVNHKTLETDIAEEIGIPYLSEATEAEANEVVNVGIGYIRLLKYHVIVPFVVKHREENRWVFFVANSGASVTYLSKQVSV